ncbi:hypothetical protein GSI_03447 [Ganoderma sinense ZZ0214-1]|uniref:Uncharacterized protein n=1 Tax=Ganoderma sinense ZZ0214-1 TaxID=1077348 RepID=A0A2G8SLM0_9APHY|nr:hypothetical protein GSI_03447 [Ganoderma sinense ZZ0214-1]
MTSASSSSESLFSESLFSESLFSWCPPFHSLTFHAVAVRITFTAPEMSLTISRRSGAGTSSQPTKNCMLSDSKTTPLSPRYRKQSRIASNVATVLVPETRNSLRFGQATTESACI